MEAKTVLLLNATVMLLISFATDHWILLKIREGPPPSSCNVSVSRQMRWLRCPNVSYALVEQHINLYRQCNDMTDLFCLLSASTAVCLQLLAVISSQQYQKQQQTSHLLSATLLLYTLPIVVTVYIIHMTNIRKPSNEAQAMYYCEVGWSLVCACIAVVLRNKRINTLLEMLNCNKTLVANRIRTRTVDTVAMVIGVSYQ
ncbi:unnamed protein product [Nippostrongylus brasiliensis]|uniref:G_PROTEIN_RECEP_F1_2 domain-containing protein n=1 Tax=Nippostrongylus brasiliensis TaxID=27835 RepID=A0A0N4YCU0_NIPBR|nr:unnamed protein product [Nippostrongylus brasiliensis]